MLAAASLTLGRTLNVVTTLPDLAAIAKEVGRSNVNVTSLIVGARDPHRLEAKPSYMSRAASADLWVAIGLELEIAYEAPILEGCGNNRIQVGRPGHVYASEWVAIRGMPQGSVTRAQGDIHPYGNPHIWLDPYNGRAIALKLAEKLGELDRAGAPAYRANASDFAKRIDIAMFGAALVSRFGGDALWQWENENRLISALRDKGASDELGGWCGKMRPYWKSEIITYHRSWEYFNFRFGLKVAAELEPKPGIEPTPGHTASVVKIVQERKVKAIVQEPFYSTRNAEFVADRTGVSVVVVPGSVGQDPSAPNYIALFDVIVDRIARALSK